MDQTLSFYELMRVLQSIKDLEVFEETFARKVQIPKEEREIPERKCGLNALKLLSSYCREKKVLWKDVLSTLNELDECALADRIETQRSTVQVAAPTVLQKKFGQLIQSCFQQLKLSIDQVKCIAIENLCQEETNSLYDILFNVEDIDDLFITLTVHGLWDYQNCELLSNFFNRSSPTPSNEMVKYKESLNCCRLSDVANITVSEIKPLNLPFEQFTVEMDATVSMGEHRVLYVSKLTASIAGYLGLSLTVFLLKAISRCPFAITWFIPAEVCNKVKQCHMSSECRWVTDNKMVGIKLGECDLFGKDPGLENSLDSMKDMPQSSATGDKTMGNSVTNTSTFDEFHGFKRRRLKNEDGEELSHDIPLVLTKGWKCGEEFVVVKNDEASDTNAVLRTVPTALNLIKGIDKPIAVLGICGPYRSGKSYFMSQILGIPSAFRVGHTTDPCTHGIMMATSILECNDYAIIFLDMEGTEAVGDETSAKTMNSLLVMITLLSSYLIYNSSGIPKRADLEQISNFAQLTSSILRREKNPGSSSYLPEFLWLLRDVRLEVPVGESGVPMTATEYLKEKVLVEKSNCGTLMKLFPNCNAAFLPLPPDDPQREPTSLNNKYFMEKVNDQIEKILKVVRPKRGLLGAQLTGPMLVELITQYEKRIIEPGGIPDIKISWYAAVFSHLCEKTENLVKQYIQKMQDRVENQYPMEIGTVSPHHQHQHHTLCGCHSIVLEECFRVLDDDISSLVLPAGSNDLSISRFKRERKELRIRLQERCGQYNPTTQECTGELRFFLSANYEKSKKLCMHVFQELYLTMQDNVKVEDLKIKYLEKAKSLGPAKDTVLKEEMEHIPGPPSNVAATNRNSNFLILMWKKPKSRAIAAKSYEIQMDSQVEWKPAHSCSSNEEGYDYSSTRSDLSPNTNYCFRIRGRSERMAGEASIEIHCITAPGRPDPPPTPECKSKSHQVATVTVHPLDNGRDNGSPVNTVLLKWHFESSSMPSCCWKERMIPIEKNQFPVRHDVELESFDEEGWYVFTVQVKNEVGFSDCSPQCRLKTSELIPGEPTDVEINCHIKSLTLQWKPPKYHPKSVKRYEVKIRKKGSDWKPSLHVDCTCTCTIDSLQPYTEYEYEIHALNYLFDGSSITGTTRTEAGCPEQPSPPHLNVVSSQIVCVTVQKMKPELENGKPVTNICIERSTIRKEWVLCEEITDGKMVRDVSFCIAENDVVKTYKYFHVKMKNEKGWSAPSLEAEIPDGDLIPSAPRNLKVVTELSGPTEMSLEWDFPIYHSQTVCQYTIKVKSEAELDIKEYFCARPPFSVSMLHPNTLYNIKVASQNDKKSGEYCEEIVHCTPYAPPCAPSREKVSINVISVKRARWEINIPRVPRGQKKITFIIIEECAHSDCEHWEFASQERVSCPEGGMMEFETNYKRYMRLRFKSEVGESEPSDVVSVPNEQVIPGVPINLTVTKKSASSIRLQWDMPQANKDYAKRYRVEKMEKEGDGNWIKVFSVNGLSCVIEKVEPCQTMFFRICAKNKSRRGEYCEPITVTTPPVTPSTPGIAMKTYNTAVLSVVTADLLGVETVCVETQETEGEWKCTNIKREEFGNDHLKAGNSSYLLTFQGTPVLWRIKTCSVDQQESDYCMPVELKCMQYITQPPTGVEITEVTRISFKVKWDSPNELSERIEKYVVTVHNIADGSRTSHDVPKGVCHFFKDHLNFATNYEVIVCASNEFTKLEQGTTIQARTKWSAAGPPTHLKMAGARSSLIKIRWHHPDNNEVVKKYKLYYRKSENAQSDYMLKTVSRMVTSAIITELETNTAYDFKVVSVNKDGEDGGYAECKNVFTKRSKAARFAIEAAIALPTLVVGSVVAGFKMGSDDDVNDSFGENSS